MESNITSAKRAQACEVKCETCSCSGGPTNSDQVAVSSAGGGMITVTVLPTTGGQFELKLQHIESVEGLRQAVAKKLKVHKDKFSLLHRDR